MKYFIICVSLLVSFAVTAQDMESKEGAAKELADAMGITSILEGVVQQTRSAMAKSSRQLANNLKAHFPDMNEAQESELSGIIETYTSSVLEAVDMEEAARIYVSIIVNGMSDREVELTKDFYQSTDGQNAMKVVAEAAAEMNEYILKQISDSQAKAMPEYTTKLKQFRFKLAKGQ